MHLVGHVFTNSLICALEKKGFPFRPNKKSTEGCLSFLLPLSGGILEIREVHDEDLYLRSSGLKKLEPFVYGGASSNEKSIACPNTVTQLISPIMFGDTLDPELDNYLQIRKSFSLMGVLLGCTSIENFKLKCRPDREFKTTSTQLMLIHMNPACFDIIVKPL